MGQPEHILKRSDLVIRNQIKYFHFQCSEKVSFIDNYTDILVEEITGCLTTHVFSQIFRYCLYWLFTYLSGVDLPVALTFNWLIHI